LSMAALAAPAQAGEKGDDDPKIYNLSVSVNRHDGEAKVKYRCDTEDKKGKHDKDKYGEIKVVLKSDDYKYSGSKWVKCDGDWDTAKVDLEKDWGKFKYGKATLKSTITDPDGDEAEDKDHVKFKKDHH